MGGKRAVEKGGMVGGGGAVEKRGMVRGKECKIGKEKRKGRRE